MQLRVERCNPTLWIIGSKKEYEDLKAVNVRFVIGPPWFPEHNQCSAHILKPNQNGRFYETAQWDATWQ